MSRISKFFEKDYKSEEESSSEEESEYEEEDFLDEVEEDNYNEDSEEDVDSDDDTETEELEKKKVQKVKKTVNVNTKVVNEKLRKNTKILLKKLFEKYNIGIKKTDEKIKDIEDSIYKKANGNYTTYLDNARKITNSCSQLTFTQLKGLLESDYFASTFFDKERKTNEKNIANITCRLEPMAGIHKCKCGCDKVYSYELQTRSADEGMTLFLQCYDCGKKWKM